jgi:hypothetical protein
MVPVNAARGFLLAVAVPLRKLWKKKGFCGNRAELDLGRTTNGSFVLAYAVRQALCARVDRASCSTAQHRFDDTHN